MMTDVPHVHTAGVNTFITEIVADTLVQPQVLFVPYWVHNVMRRNNLSFTQLLEWDNFDRVLSKDDQISLFALQYLIADTVVRYYSVNTLFELFKTVNADKVEDIEGKIEIIKSLAFVEESRANVIDRFSTNTQEFRDSIETFTVSDSLKAIVLTEGQLALLGSKDDSIFNNFRYRAFCSILKELYVSYPQAVVHATVWFKEYVYELAKAS